ncbi:MAG: hypothetical protein A2Y75_12505 [Candidatus Solincola sediminis]|uniref:SLH domain-containing protein n=1 Tax=Candidatus Solincola sediminis TaxID=1797199 RepID=A0A1F2WMF2_9ACTN|nr:MAG: hypothetical protein A2Y75_12505 [Candidatus Solincola sediminis]
MENNRPRLLFVFFLALILIAASSSLQAAGQVETAQSFNDTGGSPAEIQQAIGYVTDAGYMQGFGDGGFHPNDAVTRIDAARALVSIFDHAGENPDPSITFTDLSSQDANYRWANLAVKYGLMDKLGDGSFKPNDPTPFERVATGITIGMGMSDVAQNINNLLGGNPAYGGCMTIFMDLHCKYRFSSVWPGRPYPRGEMAFSLQRLDAVDSWRPSYIRNSFSQARCNLPSVATDQIKAVKLGFERLGCPYLYGGESEAEGGFDCSGFVYNTLSMRMGYPMMRVADDQGRDDRYLFIPKEVLQPGDAIFFYDQANGNPSSYLGHAGMYVGNGLFIHSTGSNAGVSIDCLDNNDYWNTHLAWGRRVVGGPYNDRFDTYLLLYNPSQQTVPVDVRFMRPNNAPETKSYSVGAHTRYTIHIDELYPADEVSTEVSAPSPGIVSERAMYFNYMGWGDGGHASTGAEETGLEGYFAEGYTGGNFNTWLLFANPESKEAQVEVSYLREGESPIVANYTLAASSRHTILVNGVPGLKAGNVGIKYRSTNGVKITAERAMYFNYNDKRGGHCSPAVTRTSQNLYLAEGYTGRDFDTWILLANPNQQAAEVQVNYLVQGGQNVTETRTVPAMSRLTINAREKINGQSFGVSIQSLNGVGIIAERAMYFNYNGMRDGHCSAAVDQPSQTLYLAEGYTGGRFDTWILLANPNQEGTTAHLTFAKEDGSEVKLDVDIGGSSRLSLRANSIKGLEGSAFSTHIDSDRPLLAERSMYFYFNDWSGGTNCPAIQGPTQYRFFAEGYTGG